MINSVFTSYLKRYLGLPKYAHGAAIHFYCRTWPLFNAIRYLARGAISKITFPPDSMDGYQLTFANTTPIPPYDPSTEMDDDFPRTMIHISRNKHYRRKNFRKIFNIEHYRTCSVTKFHTKVTDACKCIYCGEHASREHKCSAM